MKTLFFGLVTSILIMLSAYSDESNTITTVNTVTTNKLTIQSTLNDVVIDILRGAKTASSEVYNASKSAVVASVDFAKQQVPDVVDQFIRWKLAEKIIHSSGWFLFVILFLVISRKINLWTNDYKAKYPNDLHNGYKFTDYELGVFFNWVFKIVATIITVFVIWFNGVTIAKIVIAPKVFLIEYVVDTINTNRR